MNHRIARLASVFIAVWLIGTAGSARLCVAAPPGAAAGALPGVNAVPLADAPHAPRQDGRFIPRLRWAAPPGELPGTYAEYLEGHPLTAARFAQGRLVPSTTGTEKHAHRDAGNVSLLIDAGLYTIAAAVPTREMIQQGEVPQFYDYCRDLGVHEIRVLAPIPTGRLVGHREKRWCGTDEQEQMWEYAKKLNQDKNYPRITEFSYLESEGILGCTAGTFST